MNNTLLYPHSTEPVGGRERGGGGGSWNLSLMGTEGKYE